jgi:SOS-response transcriptional repressor LexA
VDEKRKRDDLFPMNPTYEKVTFDINDIKIIGKAKRIIINLE